MQSARVPLSYPELLHAQQLVRVTSQRYQYLREPWPIGYSRHCLMQTLQFGRERCSFRWQELDTSERPQTLEPKDHRSRDTTGRPLAF